MLNWIKGNPLWAGLAALVLIVAVLAFFSFLDKGRERHEEQLVNKGQLQERSEGNARVLNDVAIAKNAVEQPSSDQLNVVCSSYDRNCPHGQ